MQKKSHMRGFTMLEIMVVIGMVAIVGGFTLFVSMETFRGTNFYTDRNLLVAALQRARAQSMNNICIGTCTDGQPHGVHIQPDAYVVFQGSVYDPVSSINQSFSSSGLISKSSVGDIIFSQLSGTTTATSTTISDQSGHSSAISISADGQISWTH